MDVLSTRFVCWERRVVPTFVLALVALAHSPWAAAQTQATPTDTTAAPVQEVVVTGSRIAAPNLTATSPIQVDLTLGASDHIDVAVTDQGEGIDPDDLPRIFDEFVQLSNSQQLGGTGLGLPISKRLATLLGGELRVSSERGKGSTFRLTLPERIGMTE